MLNLLQQMYVRLLFGSHNLSLATRPSSDRWYCSLCECYHVGDSIASQAQAHTPSSDVVGRLGGESFGGEYRTIHQSICMDHPGGPFYIAPFGIYIYINTDPLLKFYRFLMPHRVVYA